ncbi:cobalt transporter CbiM [Desulfovibrio sp. OttesenSCG-928-M14]|nr:cobalt transporter CbiM [Desulfovibrio sp. OttesenSCG-928-M14]
MHISEGVLSLPVLGGGAVLALAGLGWSLKKLPWRHIMSVGILSAAFFVASLIHVPIGPGSAHLIMNGLLGAVLGWAAFPAITVALFLQALLFQYGGLTALGVNICIMAWPAVLCGLLLRRFFTQGPTPWGKAAAFACGALSVLLGAGLCALALALSGEAFLTTAGAVALVHLPIMVIEGFLTMLVVAYLQKTLPEVLRLESL